MARTRTRVGWGPRIVAAVACLLAGLAMATGASAATYAPLDQPGPPLTVPAAKLRAALYCEPSVRDAKVEPVLLNPGTGSTPDVSYSWNWEPALDKLGIPWCAYTAPYHTMGDIPTSGEYLAYAIRTMYRLAGRKIAILGVSQGGMSMRWALRFWPDTRHMVEDVIGLAPSNHGSTTSTPEKCARGCSAALWQQQYQSPFIQALNSGAETFAGISYSDIYTHTDEAVQPNSGSAASDCSSCLFTGAGQITNVAIQDICPADSSEHLMIGKTDPTAYALALDALTHPGPADPARVPRSVCTQVLMPGVATPQSAVNGLKALAQATPLLGVVAQNFGVGAPASLNGGAPAMYEQPTLPCYVYAICTGPRAPTLTIWKITKPRHIHAKQRTVIHIRVRVDEGGELVPVPGVTIKIGKRRATTDEDGDATIIANLRRPGRYRITASRAGCNPATTTIRVTR